MLQVQRVAVRLVFRILGRHAVAHPVRDGRGEWRHLLVCLVAMVLVETAVGQILLREPRVKLVGLDGLGCCELVVVLVVIQGP